MTALAAALALYAAAAVWTLAVMPRLTRQPDDALEPCAAERRDAAKGRGWRFARAPMAGGLIPVQGWSARHPEHTHGRPVHERTLVELMDHVDEIEDNDTGGSQS